MGFQHVQLSKCTFSEPWMRSLLQKWDLSRGLQFQAFRYTKFYHRMAGLEMALDLFNDPVFQSTFKVRVCCFFLSKAAKPLSISSHRKPHA
mmetsp:Transcript_13460/g.36044  ORF Transcript_13460/g.36044 Transcript_13460/m.36044 type:complete len:91 (+) Transcript_13460:1767-2039(+)